MQTAEFTIGFRDDGWVHAESGGTATGEQLEQLELVVFAGFVGRQQALLKPLDPSIHEALGGLESALAKLEALLERPPFLWGAADGLQRGFRVRASCADEFRFGGWSDTAEDEAVWIERVRQRQLALSVEPFGFSPFGGKTEKKHALPSVLALLHEFGRARNGSLLALDRLAYTATEAVHHRYAADPLPMAAFVAHMTWTGQFCPTCEKPANRILDRCPDCGLVFRGDPSIVLDGDEQHHEIRRRLDSGALATLGTTLTLTDDDVRVDITPLELADPASPTSWWDHDLRPVAVRVKARNRGEQTLDLLSVVDAQLIDQHGRRYDADGGAELEPSFEAIEDLDPGETVRAWIVFGLPLGAVPTMFTYQPFTGETGVWALAQLPSGAPAP